MTAVKPRGLQPRVGNVEKKEKKRKEREEERRKTDATKLPGRGEEGEEERGAVLKIRNANSIMTHSFPRPGKRAPRGKMSSAAN